MGYCPQPPALVYPFMARQSLFRNLHQWKVCYQYYVIPQVYHEVQMPKSVNTFIILAGGQPTNLETENLRTSGFCPWDFLPPFGDTSGCAPWCQFVSMRLHELTFSTLFTWTVNLFQEQHSYWWTHDSKSVRFWVLYPTTGTSWWQNTDPCNSRIRPAWNTRLPATRVQWTEVQHTQWCVQLWSGTYC